MTIEERKRIACDMGKLFAWRGQTEPPRFVNGDFDLLTAWRKGYAEQCNVMSDAAAKIPLLFADERADRQ